MFPRWCGKSIKVYAMGFELATLFFSFLASFCFSDFLQRNEKTAITGLIAASKYMMFFPNMFFG